MSFLEQLPLWAIHHRGTLLFGAMWITITAAATICAVSAVGQRATSTGQNATTFGFIPARRRAATPGAVAAVTLLAVFLAFYILLILVWEDFTYYDDSFFNLSTLKGHNLQLEIWPEGGRFCPLGLQEFNLIRHFTHSITGYHVLPVVQILICASILFILNEDLNIVVRAALVILALLTPSILVSFSGLNFQERDVLFFLACLVLSIKRFERTQSTTWAVAAIVSAQIMIYCKETAFLLLLGFAVSRLILRCRNTEPAGWGYNRLWTRESRLDLCLASLAIIYIILYLGFMGIHGNMDYAAAARLPRTDIVLGYLRVDLLPWLLVAALLGRIYLILRHRAPPMLLWDGLAFGGVACFLAYLYLSIFGIYYLAPVDLIAVLYVGRLVVISWKPMRSWSKSAAIVLVFIVLFQNILVSAFTVFERKNVIHAKSEIAAVVEAQYRSGTANDLRLFFPFAGAYVIMEFGGYLSSRGVPVEGAANEAPGPDRVVPDRVVPDRVVLAEASHTRAKLGGKAEDGPCVTWNAIWCQLVSGPAPGDLVIVLPDDEASLAEASVYRERGKLIFSYEPRPSIPHWLFSLFSSLPIGAQTRYRNDALPDRWMDGSVTMWK